MFSGSRRRTCWSTSSWIGRDASDADVTNLSGTRRLAAECAVTEPLDQSAAVEVGQLIMVRVESDLSFDPSAVSLAPSDPHTPISAFSEVCLPNLAGTGRR